MLKTFRLFPALVVMLAASATTLRAQAVRTDAPTPPDDYLGHPVGADFRLAGWETITSYLAHVAEAAPGVRLDTLGRTTQGRPFVLVTATSPENMSRLDEIRTAQAKLADPRRLADGELDALLESQPAVVLIAHNIHSTEIASSQGGMELTYALATDPELASLLQNVVVLLIPSVNPDGQRMVTDWYLRTLGTPYEGSRMPWLYHHYVGHDNNRDWYMLTQVETQMLNDLLYDAWRPELVYDVHQMGGRGARFFVPPFDDPANPNIDPLLVREISLFGLQISTDLEAEKKAGVVNRQRFDLWWHGGLRTSPARHNMVGILSEAASARLASPVFLEPDDLRQPEHGVNYPNPWPGGWWRIRDIIDYQLIAARAVIELAAVQREKLLRNYVRLGERALEAGADEPPFAFVVPADQRDAGTAAAMLAVLQRGGVEVHRAAAAFEADGIEYAAGSHVVLMAQPYRAHAKDLLERQVYPDRRVYPGGPPDAPYDAAGWTLPLQMGVETFEARSPFEARLELVDGPLRAPAGSVTGSGPTFILDYAVNAANLAINRVLTEGGTAALLTEPVRHDGQLWPAGSALVTGEGAREILEELARTEGLSARGFDGSAPAAQVQTPRIGLYQPWTSSMDEGWTRWLFDSWSLPYTTVHDAEIRVGDLLERYDVIVLPDIWANSIIEGREAGTVPSEYAGGLGEQGVAAIRAFVRGGGTLICLDSSSDFAIEQLDLPVSNVQPSFQEIRSGDAFYAPGSLLAATIDSTHPLGYGMPGSTAIYYANGPIFLVDDDADEVTTIARYPDAGQLLSGYAIHPEFLDGKAALIEARSGAGRVILFGFRPQHRGQTHETFKMLFNAVYRGAAEEAARATF
ncbi:MAG: peptidase M14 [Gemmatimonadetes bacterium]|uniref:Peptidase M14 n=1 Tax=Candidatus Kutchimonas denitrificans TaxID=3056748 RepID=A0AAE5C7Q2_9BACT|nr:peptidase M14 [Gemmatimonadota bacterium]NIR73696.1 peptidase M14 [Candidatus Kutchimonas denitrificans]NIS00746.1 peptidase M14 [Gemmatimonadota bacterium]NIT66333.1 peptidase M14 [Gemmatimonadota bacterium]NIU51551.1 peptidase M14 [Gemmatimonadota bacterium]